MNEYIFDWADLAFASKKPIRDLSATFIAASRHVSPARIKELVKTYLPQGNIVLGIAKEAYVDGLEGRPQFTMLAYDDVADIISRVNQRSPYKIHILKYFQREAPVLYDKLRFPRVVLINGSWYRSFHLRPEYHILMRQRTPYTMVSPFVDEHEAKAYEKHIVPQIAYRLPDTSKDEDEVFDEVARVSTASFDTSFQVGAVLAEKNGRRYRLKSAAHNAVVPYETYALHNGSVRERHFSPAGDQNHYDCVHAEMMLLIQAVRADFGLAGLSLFINVLPCPSCARTLVKTDIAEIVYALDHSDGYAVALLEGSGKKVRRKIGKEVML